MTHLRPQGCGWEQGTKGTREGNTPGTENPRPPSLLVVWAPMEVRLRAVPCTQDLVIGMTKSEDLDHFDWLHRLPTTFPGTQSRKCSLSNIYLTMVRPRKVDSRHLMRVNLDVGKLLRLFVCQQLLKQTSCGKWICRGPYRSYTAP